MTSFKTFALIFLISMIALSIFPDNFEHVESIPDWAETTWKNSEQSRIYSKLLYLEPGFLTGDFNGDGNQDIVVTVINRKSKEKGIAFIHRGDKQIEIFGAGIQIEPFPSFQASLPDFSDAKTWTVIHRDPKWVQGPCKLGDCLYYNTGGIDGIFFFNGSRYQWMYSDAD